MNKIFAKFMALAVSAAMIIPSVAIANEEVIVDEIEVVAVEETAATEEIVEADLLADLKPAQYAELIVGPEKGTDSYYNTMGKPDMRFSGDNNYELKDCDGTCNSKNSLFDKNAKYDVDCATDLVVIRKQVDGEDAAYTTYFHATQASGTAGWRYNRNGVISVLTAKTFDDPSNTNYVIECDYYADKANQILLIYAGESSNINLYFDKDYDELEGPAWKTYSAEVDNFYAHRVDTGLGANENMGGSASDAGFRFQSVSGSDVTIKTIRVYTPGAVALKQALDNIDASEFTQIRDSFQLPAEDGNVQIKWTSNNSAISINSDGYATVTRDDRKNVSGTITATAVYDEYYIQQTFDTTVLTSNENQAIVDSHIDELELDIDDFKSVSEDFALPVAPDGFEYEWASTNESYVDVSNGATAVVNASKFEDSFATILLTVYYKDKYAEKEFYVSCAPLFVPTKGSEIIADMNTDIQTYGDMFFDGAFGTYTVYDEPTIPEGTNSTKEVFFLSNSYADYGCARAEVDGKSYVVTGLCYSTDRQGGGVFSFNMPINVGSGYTAEDKELTIEVEYLDKAKGNLVVKYVNGAYGTGAAAGKTWAPSATGATIPMTGDGKVKTYSFTTTDAYFVEDNKTGMGSSNKADIRIEASGSVAYVSRVTVSQGAGFKAIVDVINDFEIEGVDLTEVKNDFELPSSAEGGVAIEWSSSNKDAIIIDNGTACIFPSTDENLSVTLTAAFLKDGSYMTKDFDVTLTKLPKQSPIVGTPEVVIGDDKTEITYTVDGTGNMKSEQISILAVVTDATGKVMAKEYATETVTSDSEVISVEVPNAKSGETLDYYLMNSYGAVIKNRAPSMITDITGKSTPNGGIISWEPVGDDYNHVVYDVYKDNELWIKGTEETDIPFDTDSTTLSKFYVIARDHEDMASYASKTVQAGRYIYKFVDFNDDGYASAPVTVMEALATLDRGVHFVERTGADTVDGDGVTPVTLKAVSTYAGAERLVAGAPSSKNYPTRMQFSAAGVIETDETPDHVFIIVKYFDEGTGAVTVTYSKRIEENIMLDGKVIGTQVVDKTVELADSPFQLTNKQTWKEVVIEIKDANFTRGSNGVEGADFHFKTSANSGRLAINKVTVVPAENYVK